MAVTTAMLKQIMPLATPATLRMLPVMLESVLVKRAGIATPLRLSMFLAQTAHESNEYRTLREIWGPTPQQEKYEASPLAARLGNVQEGDGFRFRGWGPLQITGRANTREASLWSFGDEQLLDERTAPSLLALLDVGIAGACWFWTKHRLNKQADKGDLIGCTQIINGGLTGRQARQEYYERALAAFGL